MKYAILFSIALVLFLAGYPVAAEIVFRDNFEYVVERNQSGGASESFRVHGGWGGAKTRQDEFGARSNGYLYTVESIPGYSGEMPGDDSTRVLAMEFLPASLGGQTDAYLALGSASAAGNFIPANVWFQFWVYLQRQPGQMSRFYRGKFLYPSKTGNYPASLGSGLDWLMVFKDYTSYYPWVQDSTVAGNTMLLNESWSHANYAVAEPGQEFKLGSNMVRGEGVIEANRWTLIRIHFDTSGNSPLAPAGQGVWRMWKSTDGVNLVQIANWIGGVTPDFTWPTSNSQGGHRALKFGTTVDGHDSWFYFDDFVIATSEASLPTYTLRSPPLSPEEVTVE